MSVVFSEEETMIEYRQIAQTHYQVYDIDQYSNKGIQSYISKNTGMSQSYHTTGQK